MNFNEKIFKSISAQPEVWFRLPVSACGLKFLTKTFQSPPTRNPFLYHLNTPHLTTYTAYLVIILDKEKSLE